MATILGVLDWFAHGFIVVLLLIVVALLIGIFPTYMRTGRMEVRITALEERVDFMREVIVQQHMPLPDEEAP